MIVYEKNNKLNINFENELDNPDIEIGKSEIKVDGNDIVSGGSSGGGAFLVTFAYSDDDGYWHSDKTRKEILDAAETSVIWAHIEPFTESSPDTHQPIGIGCYGDTAYVYFGQGLNSGIGVSYIYSSGSSPDCTTWVIPD